MQTDDQNSDASHRITISDAKALNTIDSDWETVRDLSTDDSWKFKHTDISRSVFTRLRTYGVIEEDESAMGMEACWLVSDYGTVLIEALQCGYERPTRIASLSAKQAQTLVDHTETIQSLPTDTDEVFKARDYDLPRGTLNVLKDRDFIRRETQHVGGADEYSITDTLADIKTDE